ncbi:MAG: HIT family protein [Deltaproteobacteria bacterium]|nr:HIT family protein [Deltaproteobacteria bacterium]
MDCLFCKIVSGEIPSTKVLENEHVLGIMDIQPMNRGHLLVIPKKHAANILEIDEEGYRAVAGTIHRLARAVEKALNPDGMNVLQLNGAAANQEVMHLHMHLVPRWEGDGLTVSQWNPEPGDMAAIKETADRIRAKL